MHAFTHKMKKSFHFIPYSYIFNLVSVRVTENEVIKFTAANRKNKKHVDRIRIKEII